ncbi:MAG: hypothetical protein JXA30_10005 [Deltaproteobacteria bacterium]|nr:hypothetical protein [Deltaproteobacteria bacterium]
MRPKYHLSLLLCLTFFGAVALFACEDNPEECYSDEDCEKGYKCKATYFNSGSRSGGVCIKTESDAEADAGDDKDGETISKRDSSATTSSDESSEETLPSVDAAEFSTADAASAVDAAEAAIEGGETAQPIDGGRGDSERQAE